MDAKLHKKLSERQEKGTLRSLSSFEGYTDFFSNDYLGLSRNHSDAVEKSGSTGSRLLSGNSAQHESAEKAFATFYGSEAALHFNSGFDANMGVFSSIPQKGDTILYDELIHASARDGIRLSWAKAFGFRHNDLEHLEQRLKKAEGAIYVALESLYSMDGDIAPLSDIASLCQRYDAYIIVDEAHSGGIFGDSGRGMVESLGLEAAVFIRLMTFGKAYGSHGAVVLCSESVKQYLVNFSRSFIYSTALPASVCSYNLNQVTYPNLPDKVQDLRGIIRYYRSKMNGIGSPSDDQSPIQIVEIGNVKKTSMIAESLQKANIAVKPIYAPTVAAGKERLRICLHAFNSKEEVDLLTNTINSLM